MISEPKRPTSTTELKSLKEEPSMSKFETKVSRWAAVQTRDPAADGKFVYCVKTTGIYCRPVCKARLARRSNVMFHNDSNAAEADGFRPCMRCKPDLENYDPRSAVVSRACSTIKADVSQGKEPSLRDLAAEAGLTQSHFHRVFKGVMGVTPKTHASALLAQNKAITGNPRSRPGSMTPSFGHSSSASISPQASGVALTPPAVARWQHSNALEASSTSGMIPYSWQTQIEFTVQQWQA